MRTVVGNWRRLPADRGGVTSMEYALVAFLIAVAIIASLSTLGSAIGNRYTTAGNAPALTR